MASWEALIIHESSEEIGLNWIIKKFGAIRIDQMAFTLRTSQGCDSGCSLRQGVGLLFF